MVNITQELKNNQTILLMIPSSKYNKELSPIAKKLSKSSLCYVTLNKTQEGLKEIFKKNKLNLENIVFIDCISSAIKNIPEQEQNSYFVSSPSALTEISLVISKFVKHNFEYLIFDNLTNLMVYNKKAPIAKFIHSIINKIKGSNTKAVFYALEMKENQEIIEECKMFVDKVIKIK